MSHISIEHCSKSEKQNGCMGPEWLLSVSVVYPPDHVADWKPQLIVQPSPNSIMVSTKCVSLSHHLKSQPS